MQALRSPLTFIAALLLVFSVSSCKKEDDPNGNAPFVLERLGELVRNKGNLGYNAAGEPLIQFNNYVYEWSNSGKEWKKLGGAVSARTLNNGIRGYAQDKRGVYYISDGDFIYSCASPTDNWAQVSFPGVTVDGSVGYLVANGLGDIVVIVRDNANVYRYFAKRATSAVWSQITSIPGASFRNEFPSFLCDNGILYLSEDRGVTQHAKLMDKYLDTNTGQFGLLYDKSEPANIPRGGTGYLFSPFIHASGTIYIRDGNELFKLDGTVRPAIITKVITFENPLSDKHDYTWLKGLGYFVINDAGDIKALGSCVKGYDNHWSHISGNINRSGMRVLQDEVGHRGLYNNRKSECFIMNASGEVYKWN